MFEYSRKIHYYETDMMGITHHANYVHLMEETRIAYLESIDCSYRRMEEQGIISPVMSIACKYMAQTTFNDEVRVELRIASFNGVVLKIAYQMYKQDGTQVFSGESEHCFLNREGRFLRLKREYPAFFELLNRQAALDALQLLRKH